MNLVKARVLTMFILLIKASFLFFQIFKIFSILRNFSSKLSLAALVASWEKKTPKVQMGSTDQLKLKGELRLFFHWPSHIASVLEALTSRPETVLNWSSSLSK